MPVDKEQMEFSSHWDKMVGYPETPADEILHWSKFNVNIYSDEVNQGNLLRLLKNDDHEILDLRPYMIEFPQKISRFSKISKALDLFRTYHLRHLIVINPKDDSPAGIITRKDLDAFMQYDYDAVQRQF